MATALPRRPSRRKWLRPLLLLLGVVLLGVFVYSAGPREIGLNLLRLGWGFLALVVMNLLWRGVSATAMYMLFEPGEGVSWGRTLAIRWAGESVNTLTPFGNLGGEPVKAVLLARTVGTEASAGYLVLDKTLFSLASIAFVVSGTLAGVALLSTRGAALQLSLALVAPWLLLLGWTVRHQIRGDFVQRASRLLDFLRIRLKPETRERLALVDDLMSRFWRERRGRVVTAFALHGLARLLRALDVWLCLHLLGASVTLVEAFAVAAVGMLVSTTFFFIPNGMGVTEGGQGYLLQLLGPGAAVGVTLALARRMRNYAVSMVTYLVLVMWSDTTVTEVVRRKTPPR